MLIRPDKQRVVSILMALVSKTHALQRVAEEITLILGPITPVKFLGVRLSRAY